MPCRTDGYEPYQEESHIRKTGFLREIGDHRETKNLSSEKLSQILCAWCKANRLSTAQRSPEFKSWWKDHQEIDRQREEDEGMAESIRRKLTTAERKWLKKNYSITLIEGL